MILCSGVSLFQHISPRRSKEVRGGDRASQDTHLGVGLLPQDLWSLLSELNFPLSGVVLQVLSIFLLLRITFLPVKSQVRTRKLWSSTLWHLKKALSESSSFSLFALRCDSVNLVWVFVLCKWKFRRGIRQSILGKNWWVSRFPHKVISLFTDSSESSLGPARIK